MIASAAVGVGLVGIAIWIGAVMIVIAPLVIWHHVSMIRKENEKHARKVLEALGTVYQAIDRLTNAICQAE